MNELETNDLGKTLQITVNDGAVRRTHAIPKDGVVRHLDIGGRKVIVNESGVAAWEDELPRPSGPSLLRKAANFTKAAVSHFLHGGPKSTLEIIQSRVAICRACPAKLYKPLEDAKIPGNLKDAQEVGTCLHKTCGCFLHELDRFPNKLAWADQQCPLGHWPKEENVSDPKVRTQPPAPRPQQPIPTRRPPNDPLRSQTVIADFTGVHVVPAGLSGRRDVAPSRSYGS